GSFVLLSILRQKYVRKKPNNEQSHILRHFTSILKDPTKADNDESGIISISEATVLGIALALDAFAAGFGAAMLGYSPFITAIFIALMSGLFLYSGSTLVHVLSHNTMLSDLPYFTLIMLIANCVYYFF